MELKYPSHRENRVCEKTCMNLRPFSNSLIKVFYFIFILFEFFVYFIPLHNSTFSLLKVLSNFSIFKHQNSSTNMFLQTNLHKLSLEFFRV